jgi:N-acetylglucosamine repressor
MNYMTQDFQKAKGSYKGKNLRDVQEMNRSLVIRLLKKSDVCSRANLAKLSGLNQATITNIVNDFLKWGLVKETGLIDGEKGRRSIGVQINHKEYYVIGVRLLRKQFKIGLFNIFGEGSKASIIENKDNDPIKVIESMKNEIAKMIDDNRDKNVVGIGIAVPGPYFPHEGKIMRITDFDGWDDIKFKEEMTSNFKIPVIIDHDANAGALAEWWVAPNKLIHGTVVYLAGGEGLGAGIINDGKIFRGALGTAGEIGHMSIDINGDVCECGNRGCLVHCASVNYMMQIAKQEIKNFPGTMLTYDFDYKMLVNAIKERDDLAIYAFSKTVKNLSVGIINIMCAYGTNEIIIGNELSEIGDYLIETLYELIKGHTFKSFTEQVNIRLTSFDTDPIFIGSAALAIDYCLSEPWVFEN